MPPCCHDLKPLFFPADLGSCAYPTPTLSPVFDPRKARASYDGMGRAAAAGTGLLANVVAGVGSAIGATRSGTEGEYFAGGSGGSGGGGRGDGAAPLVQLYRRTDDDEPLSRAGIPSNAATTHANFSTSCSSSTDTGAGAVTAGNSATGVSSAAPGSSGSWEVGDRIEGTAVEPAGAAGEEGGMERRSALGVASATGGAVLRGLWGGVQSAAAAGVAVAARQGGSGGDGVSGGGDVRPPSEFKLYRRGDT